MKGFVQVFDPALVPPPSYVLDDVTFEVTDAVGVNVLNRLYRVLLVMEATNLRVER